MKVRLLIEKVIEDVDWTLWGESGEGDDYVYFGWFDLEKFDNYVKDQYDKGEGFYTWNTSSLNLNFLKKETIGEG
ncbi:MAG: hypothetical protein GDA51_01390 [Ekhidna sp.]|nr:hypothetical protein [Ekhidna sp.]